MVRIEVFKTSDGIIHGTHEAALHHLEKVYGEKLCSIGRGLVHCDGKYVRMVEWIEANLGRFSDLLAIKEDMRLEVPDED